MQRNVGDLDAAIRVIVGMILVFAALGGYGTPWTWIGVVPAVTGALGWCPLYNLIGVNTHKG